MPDSLLPRAANPPLPAAAPKLMTLSVSLRLRLLLAGLLAIFACSACLLWITSIDQSGDQLVYQRVYSTLDNVQTVTAAKNSMVAFRRTLVLSLSDVLARSDAAAAMQATIDAQAPVLAARGKALAAVDASVALHFRNAVDALGKAAVSGVAAFADGDSATGDRLFRKFPQLGAPAEDALDALLTQQQQQLRLILKATQTERQHTQWLTRLLHALLLALTTIAAAMLLRAIFRPMQKLYEALRIIGSGGALEAAPVTGSDEFGQFGTALHELSKLTAQLNTLAYHDALTGLPNRMQFEHDLATALADEQGFAVVFADIDHFRTINDGYGHYFGDLVLKGVASRLQWLMQGDARLYRYSGDLFAVMLKGPSATPVDGFRAMVAKETERLRVRMGEPLTVQERSLAVCLSFGVALYPEDGLFTEILVSAADAAMFHAKQLGRNVVQFARQDSASKARQRIELADELRLALKNGVVMPYFQPIVDLGSGQIVCAEALARWRHPTRGFVPPDEFIAIAEASGQIDLLTEQLLRQACDTAVQWPAPAGGTAPRLAFNLSARQVRQGLVEMVARVLGESGLSPGQLELEITESAIIERPDTAERLLGELRAIGVSVALDDFGTGYSSLSYLLRFPIDKIKVDRSFVAQINGQRQAGKIVAATISLASNLDMALVAEGVETVKQMTTLYELGCRQQQGWLFSKALPPAEFTQWALTAPLRLDTVTRAQAAAANEMQPAA